MGEDIVARENYLSTDCHVGLLEVAWASADKDLIVWLKTEKKLTINCVAVLESKCEDLTDRIQLGCAVRILDSSAHIDSHCRS